LACQSPSGTANEHILVFEHILRLTGLKAKAISEADTCFSAANNPVLRPKSRFFLKRRVLLPKVEKKF
jgi:hypothetical protein